MYGRVQKGAKYTRFHLEIEMSNGLVAFRDQVVLTRDLEVFPRAYSIILNNLTMQLDLHIRETHDFWLKQREHKKNTS